MRKSKMMKKYNKQGVRLIDDQLLVLPDEVKDYIESDTGFQLLKADTAKDKRMEEAAQTRAVIVDISDSAYLDLNTEDKPIKGERIFMQRHAGEFFKGADDVEYRIIREGDIHCFINF